jgi:hypothetical protein
MVDVAEGGDIAGITVCDQATTNHERPSAWSPGRLYSSPPAVPRQVPTSLGLGEPNRRCQRHEHDREVEQSDQFSM